MRGDEMPDGLKGCDQILYLSLRLLYETYKKQIIDRGVATAEKKKLLAEYKRRKIEDEYLSLFVSNIRKSETFRAEYRKNRTLENADRVLDSMEFRNKLEAKE